MERVLYSLETDEERALFKHEFPHFAVRLRRLRERLACWYEFGDIHGLVPQTLEIGNIPDFVGISFLREDGTRFEARMQKYYESAKVWKEELPAPDFEISLTVDFGGVREIVDFSFVNCSDERIRAFCEEIARRAEWHYRRRFLRRK